MFARFLLGDLRYLDSRYVELQYEHFDPKRYRGVSRFVDFYSLLILGILFYALAASLSNPPMFYWIFIFILFFNSTWLCHCYYSTPANDRNKPEIKNTRKWATNNILIGFLLFTFVFYSENLSSVCLLSIFFILANINSLIDYLLTWDTYFPKLQK